mmetsp:Transcript_20097/g.25996  ORF Transcript_20097/g.25996 Transcript_20097/m.25996 type:complete len:163 (+) Transcript_20097:168-656(+)
MDKYSSSSRNRALGVALFMQLSGGFRFGGMKPPIPRKDMHRREILERVFVATVSSSGLSANAVIPGSEFCICRPDGVCFGQNCGGLKPVQNDRAQSIADAKNTYADELHDAAKALRKSRRRDLDDSSDDRSSLSSSTSSSSLSSSSSSSSSSDNNMDGAEIL